MMLRVALVVALLGLVAFAGTASSVVPPLTCDGACTISAATTGFTPIATIVSSGTTVSWISTDIGHANADGAGIGSGASCVAGAHYTSTSPSTPLKLDIVGATLVGTFQDGSMGRVCSGATQLPDGSFAMPYYCVIHPDMRGVLLVR